MFHTDKLVTEVSQGLFALAGIAAGSAYLDAKLHLSKDLNQLSRMKAGDKNLAQAGRVLNMGTVEDATCC